MKTSKRLLFAIIFTSIGNLALAQLKVDQYGRIGMGTNWPNSGYKCHIKGNLLLTTYPEIPPFNGVPVEFFFKVGNGFPGAEMGTNIDKIAFWAEWVNYNKLYAEAYYSASDSTLKREINPLQNGLQTILQLKPYSYFDNDSNINQETDKKKYGFLAQEVETILPEIVDTAKGIKLMDYTQLIPFTVDAIKELDSIVNSFSSQLPPVPPVLVSPANGATNLALKPLILLWNKSERAISYTGFIATDSTFNNIVNKFSTSDTSVFTSVGNYNTTYYWHVIAFDENGNRSGFSNIFNFTSEQIPGTATLISPVNGSSNILLNSTFVWSNGMPVYKNIIEVALDPDFKSLVTQYSLPDTNINLMLKYFNTLHFWRVTTFQTADATEGAISETWSFTTEAQPPTLPQSATPSASDLRYKENIIDIDSALEKVLQLRGVYFDWKTQDFPALNFDSTRYIGFIAQEVQPIVPEVIFQNDTGALSMDYGRMVALLVEAMKQQQKTIDSLKNAIGVQSSNSIDSIQTAQIAAIQECINNLPQDMGCGSSAKMANPEGNQQKTTFKDVVLKGEIILDQNNPNPFKESTTITYFIPEYVNFAQIVFSDNTGRIINTVDIDHTGQGQLNVKAEKLGSGIYSYSIVVDGKTVDTKKMLKTK